MKIVDEARAKYGLKPLGELRAAGTLKDILTQQKEETVDALSVVARPVEVGWLSISRGWGHGDRPGTGRPPARLEQPAERRRAAPFS